MRNILKPIFAAVLAIGLGLFSVQSIAGSTPACVWPNPKGENVCCKGKWQSTPCSGPVGCVFTGTQQGQHCCNGQWQEAPCGDNTSES